MTRYFLGSGAGFNSKMVARFKTEQGTEQDYLNLCQYIHDQYGLPQVLITRNGRSAIAAALTLSGLKKGEVIVNGFTCYAVVQGVEAAGMKPVFADIDKKTLNFTLESIARCVTPNTVAIIVQNTLGNMVDIQQIEAFCRQYGLALIEDLAHCAGRIYPDGREAGTVGQMVAWSFGKEKSIDTINGGAVGFRSTSMLPVAQPKEPSLPTEEKRARMYPTYGQKYRKLSSLKLAGPYMKKLLKKGRVTKSADAEVDFTTHRLSNWQAKLALEQMKTVRERAKRPLREFYLVKNREEVLMKLKKAGYNFDAFWYETPVAPARYYKMVGYNEAACPVAVEVSKKIINFPDYYSNEQLMKARKIVEGYIDE